VLWPTGSSDAAKAEPFAATAKVVDFRPDLELTVIEPSQAMRLEGRVGYGKECNGDVAR